jgi:hypothetical protein
LNARNERRIVGHMVVGALTGVAVALAVVAWWSMRLALRVRPGHELTRVRALLAVGVGAIAAFAGALLLDGIVVGVVIPAVACLVGFGLAALTAGADDGGGGGGFDDEPPWWPAFERELRRYDRRRIRS